MTQSPTLSKPCLTQDSEAHATGVLVFADGTVVRGHGLGASGHAVGELCFNTAMTGYQEILTDPSYAAQIIVFTFPHIGNVGANADDMESRTPAVRGCILRAPVTEPSNYRAQGPLHDWLNAHNIVGLAGVDTRALTRRLRIGGFANAVIAHDPRGQFDLPALQTQARDWAGLEGMDLAKSVTNPQTAEWRETAWTVQSGYGEGRGDGPHVVVVDYGIKHNMMRELASLGCKVTAVPASADAETILGHNPDGVLLSNGPGDPAATGAYALPAIRAVIDSGTPVFGICLGHQLLALALGAKTKKMHQGHHGANHPVKDLVTGAVEITSMNHGFTVDAETLPGGVRQTHISLFDRSNCGLAVDGKPVFSVQHHPEASPGPQDSRSIFKTFIDVIANHKSAAHQTERRP